MNGYSVEITYCNKELTKKERIMLKDTADAVRLDKVTEGGRSIELHPVIIAELSVHNEFAKDNTDYKVYVLVDSNGDKYFTGSAAFWDALNDIISEMEDEEFDIKVYQIPSKNYSGKSFITCSII